jgi:hypothetical protein
VHLTSELVLNEKAVAVCPTSRIFTMSESTSVDEADASKRFGQSASVFFTSRRPKHFRTFASPSLFGDGRSHWYNLSLHKVARFVHGGAVRNFCWQNKDDQMNRKRIVQFRISHLLWSTLVVASFLGGRQLSDCVSTNSPAPIVVSLPALNPKPLAFNYADLQTPQTAESEIFSFYIGVSR